MVNPIFTMDTTPIVHGDFLYIVDLMRYTPNIHFLCHCLRRSSIEPFPNDKKFLKLNCLLDEVCLQLSPAAAPVAVQDVRVAGPGRLLLVAEHGAVGVGG